MASMIKRASKSHSNLFGKYEAIDEEHEELNTGVLRNDRKEQKQSKNNKTKKARPKSMFHGSVEANGREGHYGSEQIIDVDAKPTFHAWRSFSNIAEGEDQTTLKEAEYGGTSDSNDDNKDIGHEEFIDQRNIGLRFVEGASRDNLEAIPEQHTVLKRESRAQLPSTRAQSMVNLTRQVVRDVPNVPNVTYINHASKCIIPTGNGEGRQSNTLLANTSSGDTELSENIRSTVIKRTKNAISAFKELETGQVTKSQKDAKELLLRNNEPKLVIFQGDPDDVHIEAMKLIVPLTDTRNLTKTNELLIPKESRNKQATEQEMKILKESSDPVITSTAASTDESASTNDNASCRKDANQEKDRDETKDETYRSENSNDETIAAEKEIFILSGPNECYHIEVENALIYIPQASGSSRFDSNLLESWIRYIEQNILAVAGSNVQIIMTVNNFQHESSLCIPREYESSVINLASNEYRINDTFKMGLIDDLVKKYKVTLCQKPTNSPRKGDNFERLSIADKDDIVAHSETNGFIKRANDFFKGNLQKRKEFFLDARPDIIKKIDHLTPAQQFTLFVVDAFGKLQPENIERLDKIQIVKDKKWLSMTNLLQANKDEIIDTKKDKHVAKLEVDPEKCRIIFQIALKYGFQNYMGNVIKENLSELEHRYFLSKADNAYTLSGTAITHSLQIHVSKMYPYEVLASCDEDFLYKYVLGPQERTNKLGVYIERNDERTSNAIIDRFKGEILKGKVKKISNHEMMKLNWFVDQFMSHKSSKHRSLWNILKQIDTCSDEPYTMLVFGVLVELHDETTGSVVSLAEKIMLNTKWQEKRKKNKHESEPQEEEALLLAAKLGNANIFNTLVQKGASIPSKAIDSAIRSRNVEIVHTILEKGKCMQNQQTFVDTCRLLKGALEVAAEHYPCVKSNEILENLAEYACLDYLNRDVENLIHSAAIRGDCTMLTILNEVAVNNQSLNLNLDLVSKSGETALTIALKENHLEFAMEILDLGASPRKLSKMNQWPMGIAA